MCGIAGCVGVAAAEGGSALALQMARQLAHRGPDDEGSFDSAEVLLGFRRLSIIDLAGGHQPLGNEDGSIQIIFNGEIYNHRELRRELELSGHRFRTSSDTEAIVHACEEWGEAALPKLNGMFAFALWNTRTRTLIAARDRFGVKPLYYSIIGKGEGLVFASEIRALLAHPLVARQVDRDAVPSYLAFRYVPAPRTLFQGIRKLPPGHVLVWRGGELREAPYWRSPPLETANGRSAEALATAARRLVEESIERHLLSDVPVGALLSGGLDSSIVVAVMGRLLGKRFPVFSIGFEDPALDERPYARLVARHAGADLHEIVCPHASPELMAQIIRYLEEPIAEPVMIPLFLVSKLAAKHVKVVLTGEGADEVFLGYARFAFHRRLTPVRKLAKLLPGVARTAASLLPARGRFARVRRALDLAGSHPSRSIATANGVLDEPTLAPLLETGGAAVHDGSPDRFIAQTIAETKDMTPLVAARDFDVRSRLPDFILIKNDKLTMAHGLEARVPFLDHVLTDWAVRLPLEGHFDRHGGKAILRAAFRDLLPRETLARAKFGFTAPSRKWLEQDMKHYLSLATPSRLDALGLRAEGVGAVLARGGTLEGSDVAWRIAMLLAWYREYFS